MSLTDQINNDIKTAMKAKDKETLEALRSIKSALLLEATKGGDSEIDEATGIKLMQKLHKQRLEAAEIYKEQNRPDLLEVEQKQADAIAKYLPQPMSEEELEAAVKDIISQTGATSMADMGKVMGIASKQLAGKADGKAISGVVKKLLG